VVLSLFSIRLITEYLGQDGFGMYATVLAFFSLFSAVIDLGLGPVTAREISREGAKEAEILGKVISLRLISSLVLALLSPVLIYFFHYSAELKIGILFAACATVFSTFSYVLNGVFQKRLIMDKIAFVELGGKLLQVALVWFFVKQRSAGATSFSIFLGMLVFGKSF
jgi:O-antigen/teichoic acid export membrane protein